MDPMLSSSLSSSPLSLGAGELPDSWPSSPSSSPSLDPPPCDWSSFSWSSSESPPAPASSCCWSSVSGSSAIGRLSRMDSTSPSTSSQVLVTAPASTNVCSAAEKGISIPAWIPTLKNRLNLSIKQSISMSWPAIPKRSRRSNST